METLRSLTGPLVLARTRAPDLESVRKLNCWYYIKNFETFHTSIDILPQHLSGHFAPDLDRSSSESEIGQFWSFYGQIQ